MARRGGSGDPDGLVNRLNGAERDLGGVHRSAAWAPPARRHGLACRHALGRALEIAVAGGHNLLLVGPPGTGKTMLARRLRGLLPDLDRDEALEVTQVLSAAGLVPPDAPLATGRPFRAPHHAISTAGMVGGGARVPRPGEVSLAHASLRISP